MFLFRILLMRLVRLWNPTSSQGFRWTSRCIWNNVVINFEWLTFPSCKWSNVSFSAAKWLIKKRLSKLCFIFLFIAVFDKQANIHFSISSISRPIHSYDHYSVDKAIVMDINQSYFRKLENSFLETTSYRKDWPENVFSSYLRFYIRSYLRFLPF